MFAKFNYSPSGAFYNSVINHYYVRGVELFASHEKEVQNCLSDYISEEEIINGTDLKEHWFAISKKDVFISHSHKDINKVKAFAGWLYECFGLEAFIDSCSWGYCDDLLNKIDKKYCYRPKTNTYDYQLRNYTTSHVHMMLSTALTQMIDNTECIIFFDTPHSINMAEELEKIEKKRKKETTLSPWIYHELSMTTMLRKRQPRKVITESTHFQHSSTRDSINIEYDVSKALSKMVTLTDVHLQQWNENWGKRSPVIRGEALDELYKIVFSKG